MDWSHLFKNKLAIIGAAIIFALIFTAAFARFLAPYDPTAQNLRGELLPPGAAFKLTEEALKQLEQAGLSPDIVTALTPLKDEQFRTESEFWRQIEQAAGGSAVSLNKPLLLKYTREYHWCGQDKLGRDMLSRMIYGSRISIWVGLSTVSIALLLGLLIGSISGYYGGLIDEIFMRVVDILMAFPGILLAIAMVAFLGPSLKNVIIALCLMGWVGYARLVRGQVLYLRELEYVAAARAIGAHSARIIALHLIPNLIAPLIVDATFGMARAILAEASLSFLGLGVQPPTPSWGSMLNEGKLLIAPHTTTFPGLAIMIVVLGFNFLGDGLRDYFDVKRE